MKCNSIKGITVFLDIKVTVNLPAGCANELLMRDLRYIVITLSHYT